MISPEEPDRVELVLHRTDEPARAFRAASRTIGRSVLLLTTDDCVADAERLKARGGVRQGFRLWLELLSDLGRQLDESTSGAESPAGGGDGERRR